MDKKDYLSPRIELHILYSEDIITESTFVTEGEDGSQITVGGFVSGWIDN